MGPVFCMLFFCLFVFVFAIVCISLSICGGLVMWALSFVSYLLSFCNCVRNRVYLSKYLRWPSHEGIVFCKLSFVFLSFCICVRNHVNLSKYLRWPCHVGIVFCKFFFVFCLFVFVFGIVCIFVSLCGGLVMWILAWVKKKPRSFSSKVLKVAEWRQLFQLSHYIITIYRSSKISRGKKHGPLSFQSILARHLFTRLPWSNNTDLLLISQQSNWKGNVSIICCRDLWHWLLAHLTLGWSLDPSKWSLFFRYSALFVVLTIG